MATESPIRMLESDESKRWLSNVNLGTNSSPFSNINDGESFANVLKESGILEEQTSVVPNRSGSAPPTVEGSIATLRSFMDQRNSTLRTTSSGFWDCGSEEQSRTDPAYIAYYYANVKLNPRLPPPLVSLENRHLVRSMGAFGSRRVSGTDALLAPHKEESEEDVSVSPRQTLGDQMESFVAGTKRASLAGHNRSMADLMEGEILWAASATAVKGENDHDIHTVSTTDQISKMQESCSSSVHEHKDVQTVNSHIIASVSNTEFPATASPCLKNAEVEDNMSTQSNVGSDISVVESRMKSLDVLGNLVEKDNEKRHDNPLLYDKNRLPYHPLQDTTFQVPGLQGHAVPQGMYAHSKLLATQPFMHSQGPMPPLYATAAAYMNSGNPFHPSLLPPGFPSPQFAMGGFGANSVFHHPPFGGYPRDNAFPVMVDPYSTAGFVKQPVEALTGDKELNRPAGGKLSISSPTNGSHVRAINYSGYPHSLVTPQLPVPSLVVPGSSISGSNHPGLGNDPSASQHSLESTVAFCGWKGQRGPESSDDSKRHSFLELLKSCNSRKLELSDISGKIVEFSADQHGSRFIQQKLEICDNDEKDSVFNEVLSHASKLMIDVFGNYVIQKFFEHGTDEQRRKLGEQLTGQVLTLSLQMYGCRVIQKALEVIELDQKVELAQELDGHVMRCVHDQNGNHVIQKCIESVPPEKIRFIISSFSGQVATLSCHPYGCRVIQRVLEHCSDEQISLFIVDEILESAYTLAQDPYGNYVTQHVLEMGRPRERGQIINKLTGKFVQMSQHKFASNVVEKCLKYGDVSERDLIIEEIVGGSDNNNALLMMMKDQFANYVVQKIFDMGNVKQKDIMLKCIQTHLPVLKRFTYAKQIVARYEQLAEDSVQEQK